MSDAATLGVALTAVLLGGVALVLLVLTRPGRSPLRPRHRVLVNLTDGTALEGVLWEQRGTHLVLRGAVVHEGRSPSGVVDGELVVERAQVRFVQVYPEGK